jgi:hypothetical protein
MSDTKKVKTNRRIVNPGYVPGGTSEAVFAAGVEVTVPTPLADKWLADGFAEEVATTDDVKAEAPKSEKKEKK